MERDRTSAGNLDGGSHICRKPRSGGLGESHTYRKPDVGSHICRKPRRGGGGGDPIYTENLDRGIPYLQEARFGIPYLQEP